MSRTYPLLLLLAISSGLYCQDYTSDKVPGNFYAGFGGGNGFGCKGLTGFHLTGFFDEHIGLSFNTHSLYIIAKNQPADYKPRLFDREFGKTDRIFMGSLMFNYEFPAALRFRTGVEGGLSIINYHETIFTENPAYGDGICWFFCPSKYLTSKESSGGKMGIALRAKLEIPYSGYAGLELAMFASINEYKSFAGLEFFLTFGRVNGKIISGRRSRKGPP